MLYNVSTISFLIFFKLLFKLKIERQGSFPQKGPFILASNHISNLDPVVLGVSVFPRGVNFLAKEELFANKFFSLILKDLGVIPLRRHKADISALRAALRILKKNPLAIFPQGTRTSGFDKVNSGVGFLYKKAKVPIVAAKIYGTDRIFPKGAKFLRQGKIKVVFGKVDNINDNDSYEDITLKVTDKIKSL